MKRFAIFLVLLVAAVISRAVAAPDWQVELMVLKVAGGEHALDDVATIPRSGLLDLLHANRVQQLESVSVAGTSGRDVTILAGKKIPLGFVDPRAGQYQVQYVDCGLKAKVKINAMGTGFVVDAAGEKMGLEDPGTTGLPYLLGVQVHTRFTLPSGDIALFARTHGQLSTALKLAWPGVTFSDTDSVVFALAVDPL